MPTPLPSILALDMIPTIQEFLNRLDSEIASTAEWVRHHRFEEAQLSLDRITEGLYLLSNKMEEIRSSLKLDFGMLRHHQEPLLDYCTALTEAIAELNTTRTDTDNTLLIDFLEQRLKPLLENWNEILTRIELEGWENESR